VTGVVASIVGLMLFAVLLELAADAWRDLVQTWRRLAERLWGRP
jgi:hypothetical protein